MNLFSDVKLLSESLKALTISRNGFSMLQSSESIKSKDIERDRAKTTEIEHFKQRCTVVARIQYIISDFLPNSTCY